MTPLDTEIEVRYGSAVSSQPEPGLYRKMALNATSLKTLKPTEKPFKVFDTQGLFLLVNPNGSMLWRLQYSFRKKRKLLALGAYPAISLADARVRRDKARELLADGKDPAEERKREKAAAARAEATTFEGVALEWIADQKWSDRYKETVEADLRRHVFGDLGKRPLREIEAQELLKCLKKVEAAGSLAMVKSLRANCSRIFRFGVWNNYCKDDPAAILVGAFESPQVTHMATVTRERIPELLAAIDAHPCEPTTKAALRLYPLIFLRSIEMAAAEWTEIDLDRALWEVPAVRMKKRRLHVVPLPRQAVAILDDLRRHTGERRFVFYSWRRPEGHMDQATPLRALHTMGFKGKQTQHGFRALADTTLSELRSEGAHTFSEKCVSLQLSHKIKDTFGRTDRLKEAYDRAELLDERRRMLQWWADYLDTQRQK